jgi:hypothetical protein
MSDFLSEGDKALGLTKGVVTRLFYEFSKPPLIEKEQVCEPEKF